MTEQEQNIAIAEACGFHVPKWIGDEQDCECGICGKKPAKHPFWPDYTRDLNAMHAAEKTLTDEQHCNFRCVLIKVTHIKEEQNEWNSNRINCDSARNYCSATAAQRAEAFLKTIGKWKP